MQQCSNNCIMLQNKAGYIIFTTNFNHFVTHNLSVFVA